MEIKVCLESDISDILSLYEAARNLQIQRQMVVWPYFDHSFLKKEILEQRQWKIVANNLIACNWTITFNDQEIWGHKDKNDAIYIHRICTNPTLRGNRFIDEVTQWAKNYATAINRKFVRLDTLGNNTKLIEHYSSAGFEFLGIFKLTDTVSLPAHYQKEPNCCLFEMDVEKMSD